MGGNESWMLKRTSTARILIISIWFILFSPIFLAGIAIAAHDGEIVSIKGEENTDAYLHAYNQAGITYFPSSWDPYWIDKSDWKWPIDIVIENTGDQVTDYIIYPLNERVGQLHIDDNVPDNNNHISIDNLQPGSTTTVRFYLDEFPRNDYTEQFEWILEETNFLNEIVDTKAHTIAIDHTVPNATINAYQYTYSVSELPIQITWSVNDSDDVVPNSNSGIARVEIYKDEDDFAGDQDLLWREWLGMPGVTTDYDGEVSAGHDYDYHIFAYDNVGHRSEMRYLPEPVNNWLPGRYVTVHVVEDPCLAPATPAIPSPANHATGLSMDADLDWADSSDADSYDVFFGTSFPPQFYGDTPVSNFQLSTLDEGKYYWKIVAHNSCGESTEGPVWDFETETVACPTPGMPAGPSPANHATGVSPNVTLDWADSSDADSYYIYFGTSSPPQYYENSAASNFTLPALAQTTFYWKIVARNDCGGSTAGPVWNFNTEPAACNIQISPTEETFTASGGAGTINVTAPGGCSWSASTDDWAWITITSGSGSGNGTVTYDVVPYVGSTTRTGTISVAGNIFTVTQQLATSYSISGYVRDGSGNGVSGVALVFSPGGSASTDSSGFYSRQITGEWSGTVTPYKFGYNFNPTSRTYSNAASNQTNQNFTAIPKEGPVISGFVRDESGTGISSVTITFSNGAGNATTGGGGNYSHQVPYNWSGSITPTKSLYTFTPPSEDLQNLQHDADVNFTGTLSSGPVISGYIAGPTGHGIGGVTVIFDNGGGSATTNSWGYYQQEVPYNWSGTANPSKPDYLFTPASRSYWTLEANKSNQHYTGYPPDIPAVSGFIRRESGDGHGGITVNFSNGGGSAITDLNGFYIRLLPAGWSGTATPSFAGYVFLPASRSFSDVNVHETDQDFTAIQGHNPDIWGRVHDQQGHDLAGVTITFSNGAGSTVTDGNGEYRFEVPYYWSGTATPFSNCYDFSPGERSYTNVIVNQGNQSYTGSGKNITVSGYIRTPGGLGIENVELTGFPDSVTTNENGFYSTEIACGWSGTVTPISDCLSFNPASQDYVNLDYNVDTEDYVGSGYEGKWYVDSNIAASGDGKSWSQAFKTLEEAIQAACETVSAEIWVKKGTYPINNRIRIEKKVALYGGFEGSETERIQRNWEKNKTVFDGLDSGRMFLIWADAVIDGFVFENGHDDSGSGSALYIDYSAPKIINCIFNNNHSLYGGAVQATYYGDPTFINCKFAHNTAWGGGAICAFDYSHVIIINCLFYQNEGESFGGAVAIGTASLTITNSTFYNNSAVNGGAISSSEGELTITNSILWGNSATSDPEISSENGSSATISYSNINQDGYANNNNISLDPMFSDPDNGDLRLMQESPCIDRGDNTALHIPAIDFEGESRIIDGDKNGLATVDMGADEFYFLRLVHPMPWIHLLLTND